MKKESIKKVIELAGKFYDVINNSYGKKRNDELKKVFGDSLGYHYDDVDEGNDGYVINNQLYQPNDPDLINDLFKVFGVKSEDYDQFLKEVLDYTIKEERASRNDSWYTYNDGLKVLSLITGLFKQTNGVVVIWDDGESIEIATDGWEREPILHFSYDPNEFLIEYSK